MRFVQVRCMDRRRRSRARAAQFASNDQRRIDLLEIRGLQLRRQRLAVVDHVLRAFVGFLAGRFGEHPPWEH